MPTTEQKELLFYVSEHGQVAAATVRLGCSRCLQVTRASPTTAILQFPAHASLVTSLEWEADENHFRFQLQLLLGTVGLKSQASWSGVLWPHASHGLALLWAYSRVMICNTMKIK